MTYQKGMTHYLAAFIHGLKMSGIKKVVISPGSRSTPLALLLHREKNIDCYIDVDERSAGFFALGLAKETKQPVGLLCTSGTAAANYYPAVAEAKASEVPLVVLTADRPPELQDVGAPQTMDQHQMYHTQVKKFVELAVPEGTEQMLRYSYWQGMRMTLEAQKAPKGPVHINIPLREPLLPDLETSFDFAYYTHQGTKPSLPDMTPELHLLLKKHGLLIIGGECTIEEAQMLLQLAEKLNWPILGDPLTNLGSCGKESKNHLKQADLIFSKQLPEQPEVIIRFGKLPVTKTILLYLQYLPLTETTIVLVDKGEQWQDQLYSANLLLPWSICSFCEAVRGIDFQPVSADWLNKWQKKQRTAQKTIQKCLDSEPLSESKASVLLTQEIRENEVLFLSNSNAIRFIDRLSLPVKTTYEIYGNRGVNGIDGILSTAAGIAAASEKRVYVLIGDLAFFHDMNGLQMIRQLNLPVTIILLNNNGGGIFSFLSQRQLDETDFEPLFSTPLNLEMKKAAALYDGQYANPKTAAEFKKSIQESRKTRSWTLIEVNGKQEEPVRLWQEILTTYHQKQGEGNV
ncbi:2-succinyl-5-enolpyruvyl-6-hydroxy-3-cyclohexene-1-carboxylic-acid synthase [Enterococcus sp. DIV0240a]|uniref:2-succinyl-5-enolpyruvyl-6-hydroxy-3- cyclohexene-1-carboxylic-acid synthase n=2 Tax=Enterococcus TaxID=1350 RepID=UPI003D2ADC1B